jgi:hypothetical protein
VVTDASVHAECNVVHQSRNRHHVEDLMQCSASQRTACNTQPCYMQHAKHRHAAYSTQNATSETAADKKQSSRALYIQCRHSAACSASQSAVCRHSYRCSS